MSKKKGAKLATEMVQFYFKKQQLKTKNKD